MRLALAIALGVLVGPTSVRADDARPDLESRSAVVLDSDSGAELLAKDADKRRPIASTTKIFVAMAVRAHHLDLDKYTEIKHSDAREARGGSRTRLDVGRKFRNRDLLRAMLMASDNRAPTALGRAAGMTHDQLVAAMNKIARKLHLRRTKLTCPTGLHGNTSTAREMAIALRAALEDRVLRKIMGDTFQTVYPKGRHRHGIGYGSTNRPLVIGKYDVIGGKTGYTHAAGYCFITAVRVDGREILTAFFGAKHKPDRFEDFNRVASWLEEGAPGSKISLKRPHRRRPKLDVEARGRVANP